MLVLVDIWKSLECGGAMTPQPSVSNTGCESLVTRIESPKGSGNASPEPTLIQAARLDLEFPGLETGAARGARRGGDLANVTPSLFVVGNDQFVDSGRYDVSLYASREGEQHERLLASCGWRRIRHRLRRAVVVVYLNEIARRQADLLHVLRVHLDVWEGPAVHDEFALLVEIGALPYVVGAAIVDEKGKFLRLLLLAGRL